MTLTELGHVERWTREGRGQRREPGAGPRRPKESRTKMVDSTGKGSWGEGQSSSWAKELWWRQKQKDPVTVGTEGQGGPGSQICLDVLMC